MTAQNNEGRSLSALPLAPGLHWGRSLHPLHYEKIRLYTDDGT